MRVYEDEVSQTLARSLIPCDKLVEASRVSGKSNKFELLKLLLNWFKTNFFSWIDIPNCELCERKAEKCEGWKAWWFLKFLFTVTFSSEIFV